jgi:chemotaxis protein methyltransferase WspC
MVQDRLAAAPGRPVRILSVPCAGGEEPYSLAMALMDAGVPQDAWRIVGVDLSPAVLERARAGRFTRNAFRGRDQSFRARYFRQQDGVYEIDAAVRAQVTYRQGNLLEMLDAERYDLVFCRNLLIYFDEPTVARAIARLSALLADEGVLFAGYAEVPAFTRHGFVTMRAPGAFALRKAQAAPPQPPASAARKAVVPARTPPPAAAPPRKAAAPALAPPSAPFDLAAQLRQARRLADAGQLAEARVLCRAALEQQPDCAEAHFLLGVVSEAADQRLADAHYRRCIYVQPEHYEALCHLALLCEHSGEMAQAAAFKQRAARVYARRAGPAT